MSPSETLNFCFTISVIKFYKVPLHRNCILKSSDVHLLE